MFIEAGVLSVEVDAFQNVFRVHGFEGLSEALT
jgi:hypothetical protein